MIKFTLRCENDHGFESWFPDGESFEAQARRGLLSCPACQSRRVGKGVMAPAVLGGAREIDAEPKSVPVALLDERQSRLREMARALRREVEANTIDVGKDFARAARAIHDGEAPERPIRGQASPAEARALMEEGIGVMPLPPTPEEMN